MAQADSPTKLCGEDGCGRSLRARGLCSTHYNQQHQPERHRKVVVQCGWCGKDCEKEPTRGQRYAHLFCSMSCAASHRLSTQAGMEAQGRAHAAARAAGFGGPWSRRRVAEHRIRKAARGIRGHGRWVGGRCQRCGGTFMTMWSTDSLVELPQYCSDRCRLRAKMSRRRHRVRGVRTEPYSRFAVFERDRWRCHICRKRVDHRLVLPDPMAATVDHLVPIESGGADALDNVALAHMVCNSRRRQYGTVQLLLFGDAA